MLKLLLFFTAVDRWLPLLPMPTNRAPFAVAVERSIGARLDAAAGKWPQCRWRCQVVRDASWDVGQNGGGGATNAPTDNNATEGHILRGRQNPENQADSCCMADVSVQGSV